jgi:hypothetical protein
MMPPALSMSKTETIKNRRPISFYLSVVIKTSSARYLL